MSRARHARMHGSNRLHWAVLLLLLILYAFDWLASIDRALQDFGAKLLNRSIDTDIVLVDIDSKSLRELDVWPWPRSYYANLLDRLSVANPAVVIFDIDFSSRSTPQEDQAFAKALERWSRNKIKLVAFLQYADASQQHVIANYPIDNLRRHVSLASINLYPAEDGLVRTVSRYASDHPPAVLPLADALSNDGVSGKKPIHIDFSIDPDSFRSHSFADVVKGRVETKEFAGKTVIVGATAIELRDQVAVPVHGILPGPLVQALAIESNSTRSLVYIPKLYNMLAMLLIGMAVMRVKRSLLYARGWSLCAAFLAILGIVALGLRYFHAVLIDISAAVMFIVLSQILNLVAQIDQHKLSAITQMLKLKRERARLGAIHQDASEGILVVDSYGVIKTANEACLTIFGLHESALSGQNIDQYLSGVGADIRQLVENSVKRLEHDDLEGRHASGRRLSLNVTVNRPHIAEDEGADDIIVMISDVTELKLREKDLEYQRTHDSITGCLNLEGLQAACGDTLPTDTGHAMLIVRLEVPVPVLRELDVEMREALLRVQAEMICRVIQGEFHGLVARTSADEFACRLDANSKIYRSVATNLVSLFKEPIGVGQYLIRVSPYIGVAETTDRPENFQALLYKAQMAKRSAIAAKQGYAFYEQDTPAARLSRLELASQLAGAISRGELQLNYQPQRDLRNGMHTSVEALARWRHPELGWIPPGEFIAIAEETGVIRQLTVWALKTAAGQCRKCKAAGIDLTIAINISAQLLDETVMREMLEEAGVEHTEIAAAITLEITESAIMEDRHAAISVLKMLKQRGHRVSLDDFGTGHSSFAYLKDLPVHEIKLDKAFIMDMLKNPKDAQIVISIIDLAHKLGLEVVAEGVESEQVMTYLASIGCEYAQGYAISKPIDGDALQAWIFAQTNARYSDISVNS